MHTDLQTTGGMLNKEEAICMFYTLTFQYMKLPLSMKFFDLNEEKF